MNKKAFYKELFKDEQLYKIEGSGSPKSPEEVVETENPPTEKKEEAPTIRNKTVVAYHYEGDIPSQDLSLLEKILEAINTKLDAVLKINTAQETFEPSQFDECQIISFGIPESKLGATFEHYKNSSFGTNQLIASHSLNELSAQVEYKRSLWGTLKSLSS